MSIVERESLGALAPAWDELVAAAPLPSPFLRSWWLEHTAGSGSTFLLVLSGTQLLGGLAVARNTQLGVDRVRLMGSGPLCPDHLDLVAAPGAESTVQDSLVDWFSRPGGRFVAFDGVVEGARLDGVVAQMGGQRWVGTATAPWVELSGDFEGYRSSLPARLRHSLRQTSSRLRRLGVRYRVADPEESAEAIEWLRRLHTSRWGARSGFLPAFPLFAAAASVGMARRELVVHQLVTGNEVIAALVCLELGDRTSSYVAGRNATNPQWRGAGNVLNAFVIERAFQIGYKELDLLRGNEPYKLEWASQSRSLVGYVAAKGGRGRLLGVAHQANTRLKGVLSSHPASWEPLSR